MSVFSIGAVRSAGATTVALGLAATWPEDRRVLLVEADPAGGTLAAASGWAPEPGLVSLAAAVRRGADPGLVLAHTQALPGGSPVLAAPAGGDQARHALGMLSGLFDRLHELDGDVLVDCGRLERSLPRPSSGATAFRGDSPVQAQQTPLRTAPSSSASSNAATSNTARFAAGDLAFLVARPQLPDLHALGSFLDDRAIATARSTERLRLLLVGDGPYLDAEIAEVLGIEVAAHLPFDAEGAAGLASLPASARTLRRAPLVRALRTLAASLAGSPGRPSVELGDGGLPVSVGVLQRLRVATPAARTNGASGEVAR